MGCRRSVAMGHGLCTCAASARMRRTAAAVEQSSKWRRPGMIARRDRLIERPEIGVTTMADPLSSLLRSIHLTGGLFLDVRLKAPWAIVSEVTAEDCCALLARPTNIISYHVALDGRFELSIAGEPPLSIEAGEIVLLPRNDTHVLASGPGLVPVEGTSLIQPSPDGGLARVENGGNGEPTHMVCGFLGSDGAPSPLLSSLPRALKVDVRTAASRDWIEASVRFAATELAEGRLASSNVMARLSEVLLVEAVRHYAEGRDDLDAGWLGGLADAQIGRALAMIHEDIRAPWSAEGLARCVALSRSAFVERFTSLVGVPPIRYLTALRMEAAKHQLRDGSASIAQVAHAIGYESEEAFSRAFKRECGLAPTPWRNRQPARP